jgi:hypothetical protein
MIGSVGSSTSTRVSREASIELSDSTGHMVGFLAPHLESVARAFRDGAGVP